MDENEKKTKTKRKKNINCLARNEYVMLRKEEEKRYEMDIIDKCKEER